MHSSNKARHSFLCKTSIPNLVLKKMIQVNINEKCSGENAIVKNMQSGSIRPEPQPVLRDQGKRDVSVLKAGSKNKITTGHSGAYDQYEEERPVNYSLKYSETEPCKNKTEKEKFKEYADYAETDLDQPTNFSLKYAENVCSDEEVKNTGFDYYEKTKFRFGADCGEPDLDQPTDFALKYRESVDEDYDGEKKKPRNCYASQGEEGPGEPYACQNETPLMFSRCSSLNSLSSFVHITQSIPDDGSVVSDFSRMTSGIISPSELPDSPTQTAPSSPKRLKPPTCFSAKAEFLPKRSVFEDDVATYKQEDTPREFSRATSLSSLNIDNPAKSDFALRSNFSANTKEESLGSAKGEEAERKEPEKEKSELSSVREADEKLLADRIGGAVKERGSSSSVRETGCRSRMPDSQPNADFALKPDPCRKFPGEAEAFEVADDVVHTYYTEGTPASISHAGSRSDLSVLSLLSGIPPSGGDDDSDEGSCCPRSIKGEGRDEGEEKRMPVEPKTLNLSGVYLNNTQSRFDILRKDSQLTAKDETATFATENSPCDFSIRSSFSDLTVSVADSSLCLNRPEEPSSQISPLHNVSPQSPSSVNLGESEDAEKVSEEDKICGGWNPATSENNVCKNGTGQENSEEVMTSYALSSSPTSFKATTFDFYSREPLTPFEEALVEQCIRLGMPQQKASYQGGKPSEEAGRRGLSASRAGGDKSKHWAAKGTRSSCGGGRAVTESVDYSSCAGAFDLDSSEPLTQFEEALLEQCIRLGMPQRRSLRRRGEGERTQLKSLDGGGGEGLNGNSSDRITPLEAVLLEQCIRLGMPQKRSQKKPEEKSADPFDESSRIISCVSAQLNRLRLNSETEGPRKGEHVTCNCGRRHSTRKKNSTCRRFKKCKD